MEGRQTKGLKVCFLNAQSVVNKMDELRSVAGIEKPDIVAITEAWTNDSIGDGILNIEGYDLVAREDRNDTQRGRGGGLLLYAKEDTNVWKVENNNEFNQITSVRVKCGGEDIKIHVIYRSPNSSRENDENLCELVKQLRGINVLIGDFNLPDIDWTKGTAGAKGRGFYEATCERFMEQHVNEATHISGNILDLILCDREGMVKLVKTEGRLGKSDHEIVSFHICVDAKRQNTQQMSRDYKRANYKRMRDQLRGIAWEEELNDKNVNEIWENVSGRIHKLIDMHVPLKKNKRTNEPRWMDSELRKLIKRKKEAWKVWKEKKTETSRLEYKSREAETKKQIRSKKNNLEKNIVKCSKTNPKAYYQFINRARTTRSKIGPLINDKNEVVVDPKQQAALLNSYFASVFTKSVKDLPAPPKKRIDDGFLTEIEITDEDVKRMIQNLNEHSAAGPEDISPKIIKEIESEITVPLAILFRRSLECGKIPDEWRNAHVTPIYKQKGKRSEPGNYRPVSLTSVVGKMMERLVKEELVNHLESKKLLSDSQHGFRPGRSPQTNLIEFLNKTTRWYDEGKSFDILYLDFAKAFDVVCHKRLVMKLEAFGIDGKVKEWLRDWLRGRKQRVKVEGEFSSWEDVLSSVIQGSVLGGPLFDIYIDDMIEETEEAAADQTEEAAAVETEEAAAVETEEAAAVETAEEAMVEAEAVDVEETAEAATEEIGDPTTHSIDSITKVFADDTKVATVVMSREDADRLQQIIDKLMAWASRWEMSFNVKKCKILHVGAKNPRHEYTMNGNKIPAADEEKDLGIWLDTSLKPTKQCAVAAKSANFALGQIQRAFHYRKKSNLIPLYKTFVRPKLEFAVSAWCPWQEGDAKHWKESKRG